MTDNNIDDNIDKEMDTIKDDEPEVEDITGGHSVVKKEEPVVNKPIEKQKRPRTQKQIDAFEKCRKQRANNVIFNYTLVETKSDQFQYNSKNVKINYNLERDSILSKLKISLIHKKYISSKTKNIDFNDEEIDFLENILHYKNDILNESDILIIAQIMRNILDDFSYEFGYINNEDVYDRVFSNFCIGK